MPDYRWFLFGFLSYLSGGIPSGYLLARWLRGLDIREQGSGNPGAANVFRTVGPGPGLATAAFDSFKGWLPVTVFLHFHPGNLRGAVLMGALAVIGHVWTVFLGFRGGKGVATSAGVFAALMPWPTAVCLAVFAAAIALTGHISAGSMAGAAALPLAAAAFREPAPLLAAAAVDAALILYKHVPNLKRLLSRDKQVILERPRAPAERREQGTLVRR